MKLTSVEDRLGTDWFSKKVMNFEFELKEGKIAEIIAVNEEVKKIHDQVMIK